jgi:hypothetical protein
MVRLLHDFVCWLLSAVLLLTNGWPVAVQHAHDVGDNPYHHSHRHASGHVDLYHVASVGEAGDAVSGVTEHVHMLWFGWEVTILPPKGGRPGSSPVVVGSPLQLAEKNQAENDSVPVPATNSLAVVAVASAGLLSASQRPAASVHRIAALPLCDSARHLRSGVQLI